MSKQPKLLLAMHVVSTMGVVGADLVLLSLGISGLLGADPRTIYPAAYLTASVVIAPMAVFSLITGLLLTQLSSYGLFRYWWIVIKLAITVVLTGLMIFVLTPALKSAADIAVAAPFPQPTVLERLRFAIAPSVAVVLLALSVLLAIYKPHWQLPGRSRERLSAAAHRSGTRALS